MSSRPRFLVIRFSSIGDIVLTTSTIRALREQIEPTPEIHFLTKAGYAEVLRANPNIDAIHTIERSTAEITEVLRELAFDYVVDLHHNLRSSMVKKRLKALDFTVDKQNLDKWLLVRFGTKNRAIRHIADRYFETLQPFKLLDDGKGLDFHIEPGARASLERVAPDLPHQYIAIALGATHVGKRLPSELIRRVITLLQQPVVLLGGPDDVTRGASLADLPFVTNLAGKLSLHASAEVIRRANQLLTGDTGLMHIGAALGKRIVSVWGCTDPVLGMAPYRADERSVIITPSNRPKRPCSKLGDRCKYGKHLCIEAIDPIEVVEALKAL